MHLEDSSPGNAGELDVSLMGSDDVLGDGQTQTGSGRLRGEEGEEDSILKLLWDSGAVIDDIDFYVLTPCPVCRWPNLESDRATFFAQRLDGIRDKIGEDLL